MVIHVDQLSKSFDYYKKKRESETLSRICSTGRN